MAIVVQVSEFRKNLAMYLGKIDEGYEIDLKKGNKYEAKIVGHPKRKKLVNMAKNILESVKKLDKKYPIKGGKNLSRDIDKILYGNIGR